MTQYDKSLLLPEQRAVTAIKAVIDDHTAKAELLEKEARAFRKKAIEMRADFTSGQFWKLEHIIGKDDVEALCEQHPSDLVAFWMEET